MILEKNSINTGQYFCLRSFACLKVAGKDAKVFLQNLIANDIEHLDKKNGETNNCLVSVITNTLGKVKFLVFIQKIGQDYLLFCELESVKKLQEHLEFFHIIEEVSFLKKQEAETNKPHPPYNIFLQARHYFASRQRYFNSISTNFLAMISFSLK